MTMSRRSCSNSAQAVLTDASDFISILINFTPTSGHEALTSEIRVFPASSFRPVKYMKVGLCLASPNTDALPRPAVPASY